ncbi:hypothetical protein HPP92_017209 [Vanilla planifolia]|uniref:Uncharacterized protein n=1 Tax=Vanilla planifolia TaxID=51239 RepID=A0A835QBT6_VANPL|nr:hypothetical protein HPP92_017209 [Vanilla planifolia]
MMQDNSGCKNNIQICRCGIKKAGGGVQEQLVGLQASVVDVDDASAGDDVGLNHSGSCPHSWGRRLQWMEGSGGGSGAGGPSVGYN